MQQRVLIIIPCYNEQIALPAVLDALQNITAFNISVVVVNDCSKDGTAALVKDYSNVALIDLPINLGIGGAMQTGYFYAVNNNFDIAIQLDGDGQHLPSELHKLIDHHSATGDNVVIGSRFLEQTAYKSSRSRRTGIYYFHLVNRLLLRRNIYDCTSGFRLFDKKALNIAAYNYPDEYPEPESLVLFSQLGLKISEVPILMQERQGGSSSIGSISAIYYMVKVSIAMVFTYFRYLKK